MTEATTVRPGSAPGQPDPLTEAPARATRSRRLRARLLPRGVDLPEHAWRNRHRAVQAFLWLLTAIAVVWSVVVLHTVHAMLEALVLLAATAAVAAIPHERRRLAASAASVMMLLVTADLVHLSHGVIEMHFLFFVIVAAVTLYQQWAPFLSAIAFVTLHHGVIGTISPEVTYNHEAAIEHPWVWAGIHGGFIALASVVGLAAWRFDELVRDELAEVGEHNRVVLDSVADAVLALDPEGRIVSANARAAALLRAVGGVESLAGLPLHDVVHPRARHAADRCPLAGRDDEVSRPGPAVATRQRGGARATATGTAAAGTVTGTDEVEARAGATAGVLVTYRLTPVENAGRAAAVLTLTDISSSHRARVAERRLRHLSAERLVERAEVERLAASVSPTPLDVPGVELAAAYVPASEALLGGDLYDWFATPDGTVHVAVIDALGKGRSATRHAVSVMHALRVLALAGQPLRDLVGRTAAVLADYDDDLMATAIVGRYRPDTGVVELASGGHPPALLVRHDGRCEYLETVGVGIGVPGAGSTVLCTATLEPGDTLVLYSDGLIEGTRDLDRGLADLARTAAVVAAEPTGRMVERLVQEPGSVAVDDDRVALVLRRL
jgi:serine phosphatase RsbU (regulator of sigma subunit)/PAS domain-containing protein